MLIYQQHFRNRELRTLWPQIFRRFTACALYAQLPHAYGIELGLGSMALIMGVDRILDMSRTAINVTGYLVTCALMEKWGGGTGSAEEKIADETAREMQRETELTKGAIS